MSVATERTTIVGKIEAEGLAVTDDPRDVNPPCVLVGIPSTITAVGVCAFEAEIPVEVIGTVPGNADAATWLLDTAQQLLVVLGADRATAGTSSVGGGRQRHPSYTINVPINAY